MMNRIKLLQVAELVSDRVSYFEGTKKFASTGAVNDLEEIICDDVTYENKPSRADIVAKIDDVGFARMFATRKVFSVNEKNCDYIYSTGFAFCRPRKEFIFPRYLYHYINSHDFQSQKNILCSGATQKAITNEKIQSLDIPLPPIAEQKRIADILDKAAAIKAKREQVIAKLDELKQSTFESMFGDPIINQNEYPTKLLSELCIRIQIGPFGSQLHEKDYIENGIPVINPTHIKNGEIKPAASLTITTQKHRELSQYHLAQDDLIVGRRGEMGRCAVVKKEQVGWMCGTGSLFLQLDKTQVNALYLQNIMSSQSMRKHLESVAQGVTMANLNKDIVGGLSIQVPPLAKQQRFIEITKYAETVLSLFEESLAKIEITISSLQNQAFTTGFNA
jgi:type I restriction enzyme S subunit